MSLFPNTKPMNCQLGMCFVYLVINGGPNVKPIVFSHSPKD